MANFILCVIIAKLTLGISKKTLMNDKLQLSGKAILITGCAQGIGHALAKHFDSKGFHVFATCRNADSAGAHELRKSCSSRLKVFQLDVTEEESVQKSVEFVKNNLEGRELWAVINNAGIQKGFFTEMTSVQNFEDCLETNAIGTVRVTKAFIPLLRETKGRVINVTSLSARVPLPFSPAYTMSKWAATGFSECLRHEMDMWGIKVITIQPEIFESGMVNQKSILKSTDDAFASIDEGVLEAYGEEFLRNFKDSLIRYFRASKEMQKVLDDVECAVCLKFPDYVYTINRNVFTAFFIKLFELSPVVSQAVMYRLCFHLWGISKPKAANKSL